jgi:hypothetical protein
MRSRSPAFIGMLGVALYASTALANAPSDQYAMFSQTTTYISDVKTGLSWQRQVVHMDTWEGAQAYCNTLHLEMSFDCGWRLPSYKELLTLVDENPHGEYDTGSGKYVMKWIDPNAFLGTPIDLPYWTSSPAPNSQAWTVDFRTGIGAQDNPAHMNWVRCVIDQ